MKIMLTIIAIATVIWTGGAVAQRDLSHMSEGIVMKMNRDRQVENLPPLSGVTDDDLQTLQEECGNGVVLSCRMRQFIVTEIYKVLPQRMPPPLWVWAAIRTNASCSAPTLR